MNLSEWVLAARNKLAMTQEQFAAELHCTKGNVSAWERGRHEPSFTQLRAIALLADHPLQLLEAAKVPAGPPVAQEERASYEVPPPEPRLTRPASADELGLLEVWRRLSPDAKADVIRLMHRRLEEGHRRAAEALIKLGRTPD